MSFADVLAGLVPADGGFSVQIGADWRQGRAIYGGLSASLCIQAALSTSAELPSLRSAQFVFLGPAADALTITPAALRRGKSTAFYGVDITSDGAMVTRGLLCFAADRPSRINYLGVTSPRVPPPHHCPDFFEDRPRPVFSRHFEMRRAGGDVPFSGSQMPEMMIWIRHRGPHGAFSDAVRLIGMADAAPPAAITMFATQAPISSVTWSVEMTQVATPAAPDDWFLLQTTALTASHGYATQAMYLWDSAGVPRVISTQCVALFA